MNEKCIQAVKYMYCYRNEVIAEKTVQKFYASFRSEHFADVNDNQTK